MEDILLDIKSAVEQLEEMNLSLPYSNMLPEIKLNLSNPANLVNYMYEGTIAALEGSDAFNSTLWNTYVRIKGKSKTLEDLVRELESFIEKQTKYCNSCNSNETGNLANLCPECGSRLEDIPLSSVQ